MNKYFSIGELAKLQNISRQTLIFYESIGTSYQRIINYAEQNDVEIISNNYEFAIHDYLTTRNRNEYITQIMFFVR